MYSFSGKWYDEIQLFCTSTQKQERVLCNFTKRCIPSRVYFKEFEHNFRKAISKNTSRWLRLRTIIFWQHSWLITFLIFGCFSRAAAKIYWFLVSWRNNLKFYFVFWNYFSSMMWVIFNQKNLFFYSLV